MGRFVGVMSIRAAPARKAAAEAESPSPPIRIPSKPQSPIVEAGAPIGHRLPPFRAEVSDHRGVPQVEDRSEFIGVALTLPPARIREGELHGLVCFSPMSAGVSPLFAEAIANSRSFRMG